ncbi:hypothetical protein PT065_08045 [Erysipelothrix rhusiopathiae]|nr:hypothetical protein [Erysipelothrix rhusiopathiae]MDE8069156.1 hypothetical protein [Erysipelothrix rhusiopathiae]MDE8071134.1 hypothetical protein [Erysipelothrix rhusiopathiae]MDE8115167.1 hypothetical protein [Erysipelothrix rhusiopathiae]MDE8119243.1 hypothetical protein [Erysipelothrix rhusiopathiae]
MWKSNSNKERLIATMIIWVGSSVLYGILGQSETLAAIFGIICMGLTAYVWIARNDKPSDKVAKRDKPKKKHVEPDAREIPYAMTSLRYLGGGTINKEKNVPIIVTSKGLRYGNEFIPIENITATAIETQSQILSRISATRMLAFGVFSLAMPKRKQINQNFLTVDYDHGFQSTLIFEGKKIVKVNSALIKAKQTSKYLK